MRGPREGADSPVTVVGIAGGSASGKTTLARLLADALDAVLVTHDRYYHTASAHDNFDHPDALDNERLVSDLSLLKQGRSVRLPVYDFARHSRMPEHHWDEIAPKPMVVVEGILLLAIEPVRAQFDVTVYVEAPDDLRLLRRIRRDMSERGRTAEDVLEQYLATVRPMHERYVVPSRQHAHYIIDGTAPLQHSLALLAGHLGVR